jgi:hypothetical protein
MAGGVAAIRSHRAALSSLDRWWRISGEEESLGLRADATHWLRSNLGSTVPEGDARSDAREVGEDRAATDVVNLPARLRSAD